MPRGGNSGQAPAKISQDDGAPISPIELSALFWPLKDNKAVLLAVSGGPDSTALMWLAARWRKRLRRGPRLVAVTVDHGLRKEARAEARAVKALAGRLGIPHTTLRWLGQKPQSGIPAAARRVRYALLVKAARRIGASHILTAHTRDDQAETVLMRLAHGSGFSGLAGMKVYSPVPVEDADGIALGRPLLDFSKARLIATLQAAKLSYADDPTNRDQSFTRARLRASMAVLAREGLTVDRLALLARRVERAEIALYDALNKAQEELAPEPWPEGQAITIDALALLGLSDEIALRLIGRAVEWLGVEGPVELAKLEALCEAIEDAIYTWEFTPKSAVRFRRTLAGAVVTLSHGKLTIEPAPPRRNTASPRRP